MPRPTIKSLQEEIDRLKKRVNELIDHNEGLKSQAFKAKRDLEHSEKVVDSMTKVLESHQQREQRISQAVQTVMSIKCPESFLAHGYHPGGPQIAKPEPSELELILRHIDSLCSGSSGGIPDQFYR